MKKLLAMLLALGMMMSLAACGEQKDNTDAPDDADTPAEITYAVEAGSAGEEVALANGFKTVPVGSQANALMEVDAGTADAAIIDLLMAGAMVGENTSYPDLKVTDQKLNSELYGVGCRKGSDLASFINSVMADAYADGTMVELAKTYGVQEALVEQPASEFTASASDSDVQYIKDKGKLVVGITEFEPMDYKDANGEWIGFDADMAKLVAEKLGVAVEFQVINWDMKVEELDGKQILETMERRDTLSAELEHLKAEAAEDDDEDEHEHHHHHHDDDEHECCCGHHHHHDDDDDDEHEHEHHHDHDEHEHEHDEHEHEHDEHDHDHCCGHHHHHHHADEVFTSWGTETPRKYTDDEIRTALDALINEHRYGVVLRAKGIVPATDGGWIHFDYVPGESDVRRGSAQVTGRVCVIGSHLAEDALKELFHIG